VEPFVFRLEVFLQILASLLQTLAVLVFQLTNVQTFRFQDVVQNQEEMNVKRVALATVTIHVTQSL
jgi:hypothetical protein